MRISDWSSDVCSSDLATMRNAYWGLAKVFGDNPDLEDDIIVSAPPANSGDARTVATITTMSISANCQHPQEAWSFIKFMNEPEWAVRMVSRSEEHTSDLQSLMRISYAVFCLKKKTINMQV